MTRPEPAPLPSASRVEWTPLPLHHGAIGNGRVIALVAPDTSIDWLCLPRFDSPSVFARLLDQERGGAWAFKPVEDWRTVANYVRNTNVLRTEVTTADGRFELYDFAPRLMHGLKIEAPVEICRLLIPLSGTPRVRLHFDPRPDYARANVEVVASGRGVEVVGGPTRLYLSSNVAASYILDGCAIPIDRPIFFALSAGKPPEMNSAPDAQSALEQTIRAWRFWAKTCALPKFAPESVLRSALCLKLHAFNDTGAIIAAATTSIPEALGSGRTWDYRFCWLRDAAFVVEALRRLSHLAEGEAFVRYLREMADSGPLQPMYGITGKRDLHEETLPNLRGYDGVGPVRIGNAAYTQRQHDVDGEMVLCLETILTDPRVVWEDPTLAPLVVELVEEAIASFDVVDTGLWEYRTQPRHYTFSKAMCWVAAHRGAELAAFLNMPDRAREWSAWADQKKNIVIDRAYNKELGMFTQAFDGDQADASNLLLPSIGLIDPLDPRFKSTVRAYEKLLAPDGLMMRYKHPDDFGHTTSSFSICSFWWVEALAMMGEIDEAVALFRRLEKYANPLGLFSEDIEASTGALLGNFPQAYTHVGLIHAAITIAEILDARDGSFRAWS
ncbi:MAG TPA: glycoside hydrolase family 15 protein [Vicinamibacterales bacterium]|nr:glycoside hydrolase family 15 protein [Vicinamibacterales bacterium]